VIRINMNELRKVLSLIESFAQARTSRRDFARRHRLHPSALSRILKVGELPQDLLSELARFERLSRTHLEVIAAAPLERRSEVLAQVKAGRSTYRLRDRRETVAVPLAAPAGPAVATEATSDPRARALAGTLGASEAETRAFALELLSVLMKSSPERVRASLVQFRGAALSRRASV
jgi:hypothetical protein